MLDNLKFIELAGGQKYPIAFDINVMETIQEKYGSVDKWGEVLTPKKGKEPKIKDLKFGIKAMINEGINIQNYKNKENTPEINDFEAGLIISEYGANQIIQLQQDMTVEANSENDSKNE